MDGLWKLNEIKPKKWDELQSKGLNGRAAYDTLLKSIFGSEAYKLFNRVHNDLHIVVHYTLNPKKDSCTDGFEQLLAFEKAFTEKANQLLEAHGTDDWA